jgi:hypothetical protein
MDLSIVRSDETEGRFPRLHTILVDQGEGAG